MKAHRKKKLVILAITLSILMTAVLLISYALRQNISLFYTPEQISRNQVPKNAMVRVGGMVVKGSIIRSKDSLDTQFDLTDYKSTITVNYHGVLPTLFREGQGIVSRGKLNKQNHFVAEEVLAKHDANYMPPEVKATLKQSIKGA